MTSQRTKPCREKQQGETIGDEREVSQPDTDERRECPECGCGVRADGDERVCTGCGLVIDRDSLDRGPEWRAFDANEREGKSRVGAPLNEKLHDRGLSTEISRTNRDANGKPLSARKRKQMNRLRTWHKRARASSSTERNLQQAFGEIDRMASALGIPDSTREMVCVIYRRAVEEGLLPGRSIEGVASAALYAGCRQANQPRSLDEVSRVARAPKRDIGRTYRYVASELGLEIEPQQPQEYIPRFASEVGLDQGVISQAEEYIEKMEEETPEQLSGKSPTSLAASAVYLASMCNNGSRRATQAEIADAANVSEVTIRSRYKEMADAVDIAPL